MKGSGMKVNVFVCPHDGYSVNGNDSLVWLKEFEEYRKRLGPPKETTEVVALFSGQRPTHHRWCVALRASGSVVIHSGGSRHRQRMFRPPA
ncbi:hypothetical protein Q31b_19180 [Novipirellula aureliae]|uniref:Uncharacterized protein n=1 Tax=Novipirellula aureliae TaxID=2527966 RepID=A0A5C6E630_9BACT|nr:hypothetical protein Q31b_19180 [Novipirellula aureliae]